MIFDTTLLTFDVQNMLMLRLQIPDSSEEDDDSGSDINAGRARKRLKPAANNRPGLLIQAMCYCCKANPHSLLQRHN